MSRSCSVHDCHASVSLKLHHLVLLFMGSQLVDLVVPWCHLHLRHTLQHGHLLLHVETVEKSLVHLTITLLLRIRCVFNWVLQLLPFVPTMFSLPRCLIINGFVVLLLCTCLLWHFSLIY